jgi:hypothetical protein
MCGIAGDNSKVIEKNCHLVPTGNPAHASLIYVTGHWENGTKTFDQIAYPESPLKIAQARIRFSMICILYYQTGVHIPNRKLGSVRLIIVGLACLELSVIVGITNSYCCSAAILYLAARH